MNMVAGMVEFMLNGIFKIYTSLYNACVLLMYMGLFICFVVLIGTGVTLLLLSSKLILMFVGVLMIIAGVLIRWIFEFL